MKLFQVLIAGLVLVSPAFAQDAPKPVKLIEVEETGGAITRQFFGQVVARQTVDLAFQVSGHIESFPAVEGETIPAGELIAELDLVPFQLSLEQAQLQKEQADRTLERYEKLSGETVSQVSIDDAKTQAELAGVALRNAEYSLQHATLTAPFDALVAVRNVANFTTISAGTPVVRLHDMSELRIDIEVPEVLFQKAGEDPDVEISATFPASDQVYPLVVREFNAETTSVGQTFRITLALPPQEGLNILPGSSATVHTVLKSGEPVIALPVTALIPGAGDRLSVLVFNPGEGETGTLEKREITASVAGNGHFVVTDGLTAGEEIVAAGVAVLEDGQSVRRFTGFPQ